MKMLLVKANLEVIFIITIGLLIIDAVLGDLKFIYEYLEYFTSVQNKFVK